jgi:hypothetical protein
LGTFSSSPTEQVDSLCLHSQQRAEQASHSYHKELAMRSLQRGLVGGVLGGALIGGAYQLPHGELIGPLFGAGVGLYTTWESMHRQNTGKVTVRLDGETYKKSFRGDPTKVALTPKEVQFQLLAQGQASPSRVRAYNGKVAEPQVSLLAPWKEQAGALRELGEQRRLVASFGQKTEDGQSALHLVDALAAAKLAAAGANVYRVNAQAPKDVEHSLTMVGFNVAHSESNSEEYRYLERTVDYTLTPLHSPADVAQAGAASHGVPEGMFGLLENATSYGEVINYGNHLDSAETYSPEFGRSPTRESSRSSYAEQRRLGDHDLNFESGISTVHHVNLPALLALTGTAAGLMTAMAFTGPGVPGPALMAATVGFLGGRAAGRALIGG